MSYSTLKHNTPSDLEGIHNKSKFLIIGSGTSTNQLIGYKDKIKDRFDVIIGLNLTTLEFENQMDYHLIVEKTPKKMYDPMNSGTHNYRRDLPRILNWKAIQYFPKDIPIYKTTRNRFDGKANIRKYSWNNTEGLLMGPPDSKGLSAGTSSMQALHLASIMGASEIYLIGTDLVFKGKYDHFYPDNLYRKSTTKKANRSPVIKIKYDGKDYETTEFFQNSAKFFDTVIETYCAKENIKVFDFSDGLITKATKLKLDEFFGG